MLVLCLIIIIVLGLGKNMCGLNDVQSVSSYSGNSASYAVLNSICSSVGYVSHVPDGWIKVRNRVTC